MKKIICVIILISVLLNVSITSTYATPAVYTCSTAYANSIYYQRLMGVNLTGDQRTDIINVARSQVGYREGSCDADLSGWNDGSHSYNNYCEYNYWFHGGAHNGGSVWAWCAAFVSWCARQANIPTTILKNSANAGCSSSYFNIPYYSGSSYTPQPGDLFFTNNWGHVGIVESVNGNSFTTIEGNTSDRGVAEGDGVYNRTRYGLSNYYFGVPNYSANSGTPSDTKAPTITGLNVKDISGDSFTVECNLNDNVGVTRLWYVLYAPGGEYQFSDSASNGYYSKKLYTKDYGGSGTYSLHLYAYDASENSSGGLSTGSFSVNPATFKSDKYIVKPKDNITFTYGNLTLAEEAKIFFSKGGEIYFSDDATKSVNYTTYFNEPGVYSVFVGGRFDSNWTYTETITIYVTEPTLSVSHSMPRTNENITFHYENLTYASSAMLCFEKNGVIYWSVDVSSSKDYTTYFQSDGEYYVFVRGYYNGSYTDSEKIKLSVATPNIVADDCFIYAENAVTFTYSNLSYASLVNLYIEKNDEIYLTADVTLSKNYEMIFEEEGLYSVYAGGYYNGSWQYTDVIYIYVATPLIESNISHIQKNDTLTFKYSGLTYANAVTLCFEQNGEVYWSEDVTDNREFTTHFQSDGEYTVFVRGVFGDDILESNKIKIKVGAPEIKLCKSAIAIGEELTLEYSGFQYANNVMLRIEKGGVVFKEIDITSSKVNLFAVDEIGEYFVYAIGTFSNNVKRESNKVSFTVKDLPTNKYTDSLVKLNSDKDLSVSVELYNINESCEVIVAAYKGNSFVTCTITPYNLETINTTLSGDIDKIKVMVWKNLSNLMPLCEAKVIPSSEFILE